MEEGTLTSVIVPASTLLEFFDTILLCTSLERANILHRHLKSQRTMECHRKRTFLAGGVQGGIVGVATKLERLPVAVGYKVKSDEKLSLSS